MTLKDMRPPEDIPALLIDVQNKENVINPSGIWRHLKKNGEMIFVDITTVAVVSNGVQARHVLIQDITERKRAEDSLKESVSLLHATIESTADGILVVSSKGEISVFNQKFIEIMNVPREIYENKDDGPMLQYVLSQVKQKEKFLTKIRFLYSNPELLSNDQIELLDGRIINRYTFPHRIGDSIVGRVWSFRDITVSKIAEEALRLNEEKFRSITEQIQDLITISDASGIINYASPASRDFFQCEPEEMNGHHFMEFIHEESLPTAIAAFNTGVENKIKANNIELKLKRKDGSVFYGELSGTGFTNGDHKGILVVLHDITKQKQTNELLKESEEKFRSIAEQTGDLISITDNQGVLIFASRASRSIFGYEPEEMCGRYFTDFVEKESFESAKKTFEKIFEKSESVTNHEYKMKRKDGTLFYGELNGSKFEYGKNSGTLVVIRDISERKNAQQELEERMNDLLRFHNLTVDREMTMIELKKEVNKLLLVSGNKEKYKIVT